MKGIPVFPTQKSPGALAIDLKHPILVSAKKFVSTLTTDVLADVSRQVRKVGANFARPFSLPAVVRLAFQDLAGPSADPETETLAGQLGKLLQTAIKAFADKGLAFARNLQHDINLSI